MHQPPQQTPPHQTPPRERSDRPGPPRVNPVPPARQKPASPIDWWTLDPLERAATLSILGRWVPKLVTSYALRDSVVPPCWYLHDSLVQELLAIYQYRNQQQILPVSPPQAMLDFHSQFSIALGRLKAWVSEAGCNAAEHEPVNLPTWVSEGHDRAETWRRDFDEWVSATTEARLNAQLAALPTPAGVELLPTSDDLVIDVAGDSDPDTEHTIGGAA